MSLINRFKNEVRDRRAKFRAGTEMPHSDQYDEVLRLIANLNDEEKESIHEELQKQLEGSSETIEYAEKIFNSYAQFYEKHAASIQGIQILELGPGTNLGAGIFFLLAGAARYVAADAVSGFPRRPKEFYRRLTSYVRQKPRIVGRTSISQKEIDNIISLDSGIRWNPQRIQCVSPAYAENLPFPDNFFDYCYSNASFEHFEQPQKAIPEVFRILKPGGLTVHTIDLRDHRDFDRPLDFLKMSKSSYRPSSPYGTNRWRASDFEKAFSNAGFDVRNITVNERYEMNDAEYASFDAYFRNNYSRPELEILGITVFATKTDNGRTRRA